MWVSFEYKLHFFQLTNDLLDAWFAVQFLQQQKPPTYETFLLNKTAHTKKVF